MMCSAEMHKLNHCYLLRLLYSHSSLFSSQGGTHLSLLLLCCEYKSYVSFCTYPGQGPGLGLGPGPDTYTHKVCLHISGMECVM